MCSRNTATATSQHQTLRDNAGNVFVVRQRRRCVGSACNSLGAAGALGNSRGQVVTTSSAKRALQQADYEACVRANLVAQAPSGQPWDQDKSTPSGLNPCTSSYQSIVMNQQKRAVQAAQACPPPSTSVARAPVFSNPKYCQG